MEILAFVALPACVGAIAIGSWLIARFFLPKPRKPSRAPESAYPPGSAEERLRLIGYLAAKPAEDGPAHPPMRAGGRG